MKLELAELLKGVEGKKINTLIGFDGFVDEVVPVSYTHLDVYKRQGCGIQPEGR